MQQNMSPLGGSGAERQGKQHSIIELQIGYTAMTEESTNGLPAQQSAPSGGATKAHQAQSRAGFWRYQRFGKGMIPNRA